MFKKIRKIVITSLVTALLGLSLVPALAGVASAADATNETIPQGTCQGAELKFGDGQACQNQSETRLNSLIAQVINIFSVVVGIVAVIMIIVGGFRYITSGGDSGNVSAAKNTILYAIVGLVIVALAQFIVKFVLDKATQNN